jgi:flagellar hook-associated protein 3 FlgL
MPTTGDYNGGADAITQQVDTARNMQISHTGQSFRKHYQQCCRAGGYGQTNMFKILDSAIASLKTPIETIRLPQRRKAR